MNIKTQVKRLKLIKDKFPESLRANIEYFAKRLEGGEHLRQSEEVYVVGMTETAERKGWTV